MAADDLWTFTRKHRIGGDETVRVYPDDLGQLVISTENDDCWAPVVLDRGNVRELAEALADWLKEN